MSEGVKNYVATYLRGDTDFRSYIDDIEKRRDQPPPGQATFLGPYTWARHQQLLILKSLNTTTSQAVVGPAAGRRSLGGPHYPGFDGSTDFDDDIEMEGMSSSHAPTVEDSEFGYHIDQSMTKFSDYSAMGPEDSSHSESEDQVNVALMAYLSAMTMCCEKARLDWDVLKNKFTFQLGHAKIRTVNDGCLRSRQGGEILAIIEVKPFRLLECPETTLMQIGIEMMANILHSVDKSQVRERYVPPLNTRMTRNS